MWLTKASQDQKDHDSFFAAVCGVAALIWAGKIIDGRNMIEESLKEQDTGNDRL